MSRQNYRYLLQKLEHFKRKYYKFRLVKGGVYSLLFLLSSSLIVVLAEYFVHASTLVRSVLFYLLVLTNMGVITYFVIHPILQLFQLRQGLTDQEAARAISNHFPHVKDKLLNTLQLQSQKQKGANKELIEASIDQKTEELRPIPFQNAIDLSKSRQYLPYLLIPGSVILLLILASPQILTDSSYRILNHRTHFEAPQPFQFNIQNNSLQTLQSKDFTLRVSVQSQKYLPNQVYIKIGGQSFSLDKKTANQFRYTFNNVQQDKQFQLYAGNTYSRSYRLEVHPKPILQNFEATLNYPAYTGKKDERLENIGDLVVPAGTHVKWQFSSKNTDSLFIKLGKTVKKAQKVGSNTFEHQSRLYSNQALTIFPSNQYVKKSDSVNYYISVTPDARPEIKVTQYKDTINENYIFFNGHVSDDYGVKKLLFKYNKISSHQKKDTSQQFQSIPVSIAAQPSRQQFFYTLNLKEIGVTPGDQVKYFFEVWDNDAIHGSKSSRSQVLYLQTPTVQELEEKAERKSASIQKKMKTLQKKAQELKKESEKLKNRVLRKKSLSWEEKQAIKQLLSKQQSLKKELRKLQQQKKEYYNDQSKYRETDEETKQKQERINELYKDMMSQKLEETLKKLQDLLDKNDKKNVKKQLQNMEQSNESMAKKIERMEELYKQLEFEKKIKETARSLDSLTQKQQQLSKKSQQKSSDADSLARQQKQLNQKFKNTQEDIQELQKLNQKLERPNQLNKTDQQQQEINKKMNKSLQQLKQQQKQDASDSQQEASDKMKKLSENYSQMMAQMKKQMIQLNLQTVRQLLDNLIQLSHDQEKLMDRLGKVEVNSPKYVELMEDQHQVKEDIALVKDSLYSLSKRVFQLESIINKEVTKIDRNLQHTINALEQRHLKKARSKQQYVMTSMNNLAVMLQEMMDQMQKRLAQQMKGQQCCQKPGGGGGKKSKLSKQQKKLNQQIKKMGKSGKPKKGKTGQGRQNISKELARLARQQAKIREKLQEKAKEHAGDEGDVEDLSKQMEETEEDLVNKELSAEMIERQRKIMSRLLEAEKAMRKQKQSKERKAQRPDTLYQPPEPPAVKKYKKMKEQQMELYKTVPPSLKPYYKQLVEKYFKNISYQ